MIASAPPAIVVCARCAYATLGAALAAARSGARIEIREAQRGRFVVRRTVALEGAPGVTLDGDGATALEIDAPDVQVHGLRFVSSGNDPSGEHPALAVRAPRAVIEANRFDGTPFALSLLAAPDSTIRGNTIVEAPQSFAGDPIRLWESPRTRIEANAVTGGRDVLISYSDDVVVRANTIEGGRYGLHDMFSQRMIVRENMIADCSIGTNFMYAKGIQVVGNRLRHNRGAAGYGIGLESVDDALIEANVFDDNHVGINAIDSPSQTGRVNRIRDNVFAANGVGLAAQSDASGVEVSGNAFIDNLEQTAVSGGGSLPGIAWQRGARGNYWSDYGGYDRDGDGIGDIRYAPASLFETIADAHPELSLYNFSPALGVLEFVARALPELGAQPKLVDRVPLMQPAISPLVPRERSDSGVSLALASLALAAFAPFAALSALAARRPRLRAVDNRPSRPGAAREDGAAIVAQGITKSYGRARGIVDATFTLARGETVVLWGPNGAGKTTLLRCLLGQVRYDGELIVEGHRPSPGVRASRERVGYAPQSMPLFELPVRELVALVARLRGAGADEAQRALERLEVDSVACVSVAALSGGTRQRLGLALALIGSPRTVVLDEPTAGLDRRSRRIVLDLLAAEKRRGTTLVFTSHVLADVERLADRVLVIEEGRIIDDLPVELFAARERREMIA
jgi:nitrous oxidase accessory protein